MGIRYAFDIGTNSIGLAVWRTGKDPQGVYGEDCPLELLWSGVRLFKDGRNPKDGQSLAVMRRLPKQARKRRDRFVLRKAALMQALVDAGLMPVDAASRKALESLDPYRLRVKGLDEPLTTEEFGRVLFHLNQRRGFQSNRKTDKADQDKGKIAAATERLLQTLKDQNCRTFGEFLWSRHRGLAGDPKNAFDPGRKPTRIRLDGVGAKALYEFYPTRDMVRQEFEALWSKQASFHPELTAARKDAIAAILFRQRALKPPKIGRCTFVPEELRLPKALPSVQAREVYERLGHLRVSVGSIGERPLTPAERDTLAAHLLANAKMTFMQVRKKLKLDGATKINFEEAGEKDFRGLITNKVMAKAECYGPAWSSLSFARQDAVITRLLSDEDDETVIQGLHAEFGLTEAQARHCLDAPLPDGYGRLGSTANAAILDALIHERDENGYVVTYAEAVKRAGWHHSDERDGVIYDRLPYYGEVLARHVLPGTLDPDDRKNEAIYWGRINNPSVHIGLNQLRRVINEMVPAFGPPDQIVVELARELKLSAKQKEQEQARNRENKAANEKREAKLKELGIESTAENRALLRLFEEQMVGGVVQCPFSGQAIAIHQIFTPEIEVEHLLPRSKSLDDSAANKVLCYRDMNRIKRGKTPWDAFHNTPEWPDIAARAACLPPFKRWRFDENAMKRFEGDKGFLGRQLNETRYLSKLAKLYLGKVCNPDEVYVTPGTLTGLLRGKWGLNGLLSDDNRKNRTDHRHHAVDAAVIGAMTRGLLNYLARQSAQAEATEFDDVLGRVPWPFEGFRDAIRTRINDLTVSNKPEHGKDGALHEDTAYGFIRDAKEVAAIGNLVRRKPLVDLTANEVDTIRDKVWREQIQAAVAPFRGDKGKVADKNGFAAALTEFGAAHKIRHIRVGKEDKSAIAIKDRHTGKAYKALTPGENHHIDIVQMRDGSWLGFAATVFEVNQTGWRPVWERDKLGGKLVMRLHKGDAVAVDDKDGIRRIKTVVQIQPSSNRVCLAANNEGGEYQKRHDDPDDSFRWDLASISGLKDRHCVPVKVDTIGRVSPKVTNVLS